MNKARLARADEAVRASVRAEGEAIAQRLLDWIESLPPDVQQAYWRMHSGDFVTFSAEPVYLELCGGNSIAPLPGDDALIASAVMPDDVRAAIARANEIAPVIESLGGWEGCKG